MRLLSGDLVGHRFVIERVAGSGGMATVYRARDKQTGMRVALKLVEAGDAETLRRFDQEARSLVELRHPNVVGYVAHGALGPDDPAGDPHAHGGRWLAMEWLEGESLAERLRRGPLSIEDTITLGARVARTLEAAHAHGVIHRDIKPQNLILLGSSVEEVRLIDFGIAQTDTSTSRLTQTGMALGTPGYMAPEQARGDGTRVDGRADLFSLGAVLFECLTGRPAFEGNHLMALLARLLFEEPSRVHDHRPEAPSALDRLVAVLLSKSPEERPRDAGAVALALESMVSARSSIRPPRSDEDIALGFTERRLFAIVAVHPRGRQSTTDLEQMRISRERAAALEAAVRPFSADVSILGNGALFVSLSGKGSARDLTARAARAALAVRTLIGETSNPTSMAVVTGLGEANGKVPIGEIAERAVVLLQDGERYADVEILIDEVTAALLDGRFEVRHEKADRILERERAMPEQARTLLGRKSPFLGRDRELRMMEDLVTGCFDDPAGRAVIVVGAAGMGKSRLKQELLARIAASRPDVVVESGRGDHLTQGSPFSLIASALQTTAGITAGEPQAVRCAKLEETFGPALPPGRRKHVIEFLGEMTGISYPDEHTPHLRAARQNASLMADRVREAYLELLAAELAGKPRLLVLEDLQWGDAASVNLVDAALRAFDDRPFAVLALGRPELAQRFPRLWEERDVQTVRLPALGARATSALVRHYLEGRISEAESERVVTRAAGNPFYLEEIVRAIAEDRGNEIPETALGMVESRLAALAPAERRLLRLASVFGKAFWVDGLAALAGTSSESLAPMLALLEARELVSRNDTGRFSRHTEYEFRHALLEEGSYATLTESDRKHAHKRAGQWLLSAGETDPRVLAEHFGRAGDAARAIGYYVLAAEHSLAAGDNDGAVALAEAGLTLGATGEEAAELRAIQTDAWTWSSQYVRAHEAAQVALFLAKPGSASHARAIGGVITNGLMLRRVDVVEDAMADLIVIDPEPRAVPTLAWAFAMAVSTSLFALQRDRAERFLRRMEEVTLPFSTSDPVVMGWLASTQAYWARFVEQDLWNALELDRLSARGFREAGDPRSAAYAEAHIAGDLLDLGAFEDAESSVVRVFDASPTGSLPALLARSVQAWICFSRGAITDGIHISDLVAKEADDLGESLIYVNTRLGVIEARIGRGDLDQARRDLDTLEMAARAVPLTDIWFTQISAALELAEGHIERAATLLHATITRGTRAGIEHRRFTTLRLWHAKAVDAIGRRDEAILWLRRLTDELATRARSIGDPTLRKSYLERVPTHAKALALHRAWTGEDALVPRE